MTSLVECVERVRDCLAAANLGHAFGGALALSQHVEPRATVDIDVNVFVPVADTASVVDVLGQLGLAPVANPEDWRPVGGLRLRFEDAPYPVDVFPSIDERYDEIEERVIVLPFGPRNTPTPFLALEDLVLFKLSFGRSKDWVDLETVVVARPDLDVDAIESLLVDLRGPGMHPRAARLRAMLRGAVS